MNKKSDIFRIRTISFLMGIISLVVAIIIIDNTQKRVAKQYVHDSLTAIFTKNDVEELFSRAPYMAKKDDLRLKVVRTFSDYKTRLGPMRELKDISGRIDMYRDDRGLFSLGKYKAYAVFQLGTAEMRLWIIQEKKNQWSIISYDVISDKLADTYKNKSSAENYGREKWDFDK